MVMVMVVTFGAVVVVATVMVMVVTFGAVVVVTPASTRSRPGTTQHTQSVSKSV